MNEGEFGDRLFSVISDWNDFERKKWPKRNYYLQSAAILLGGLMTFGSLVENPLGMGDMFYNTSRLLVTAGIVGSFLGRRRGPGQYSREDYIKAYHQWKKEKI